LARAPALQAGGHRFDSDILHHPPGRTGGARSKTIAPQRIACDPKARGKARPEGGKPAEGKSEAGEADKQKSSFDMKM
jgi:hypothetical protein